jgi:hypothetical protein
MSLDINKLLNALENDDNASIMEIDYAKMASIKNDILQKLQLPKEKLKTLHKQLKEYRYVDTIDDIRFGSYIRWIPLKNPNDIKLTNGGIICDMKSKGKDDSIIITCKNRMNRLFNLKLEECMIFQKLTSQEEVILSAMKFLTN